MSDIYDAEGLEAALRAAGLPVQGASSNGDVRWDPRATAQHRAQAEVVKAEALAAQPLVAAIRRAMNGARGRIAAEAEAAVLERAIADEADPDVRAALIARRS